MILYRTEVMPSMNCLYQVKVDGGYKCIQTEKDYQDFIQNVYELPTNYLTVCLVVVTLITLIVCLYSILPE